MTKNYDVDDSAMKFEMILIIPALMRPVDNLAHDIFSNLPKFIVHKLKIPFEVLFPAYQSRGSGNILNANFNLVEIHQPYDAMIIMDNYDTSSIIENLKKWKVQTIYASGDASSTMRPDIIEQFDHTLNTQNEKKFVQIDGLHELFSSRMNSSRFFEIFNQMIETAITQLDKK